MTIKKYTVLGNILFYIGLLVFIFGLSMNENIGWKKYYPEHFTSYSTPVMIFAIVMILATNFFRIKKANQSESSSSKNEDNNKSDK